MIPPLDPLRFAERCHGHLGWLAALALGHPAILLRRARRRAHLSVALAVALVTTAAGLGAGLYPAYRASLRQPIFASAAAVGYLFERKEHLAFGAVAMAWAGALSYVASRAADPSLRDSLHRTAHVAFVAAALFALTVAVLGTVVASYRSF